MTAAQDNFLTSDFPTTSAPTSRPQTTSCDHVFLRPSDNFLGHRQASRPLACPLLANFPDLASFLRRTPSLTCRQHPHGHPSTSSRPPHSPRASCVLTTTAGDATTVTLPAGRPYPHGPASFLRPQATTVLDNISDLPASS
ncbi:hypothetical protein FNV43_RR04214 [Rhamnella rubrinervis]|uniref:Uncharacterized protein n=1 Tax=Rhamnella rubrinervis TaxID=2594499 RepID=A0A8K0MQ13_9ROSA|nr:hypothetical protein FNV43_RR04214 [Rhamnella rubrinervis]